jgi:hypothetical protein
MLLIKTMQHVMEIGIVCLIYLMCVAKSKELAWLAGVDTMRELSCQPDEHVKTD